MATVRSTRRRLIQGTAVDAGFNYVVFIGTGSGYSLIFYNTSWVVRQHETLTKPTSVGLSGAKILLDPSLGWYYAKTGSLGSSQRTNTFGFIQTSLANMTYRYIMRNSTTVAELSASGVTESYNGGDCAMHPSGDVIMNWMSGGATSFKAWRKNANNDWTYFNPGVAPAQANTIGINYSPDGTQFAVARQNGAQIYQVWRVDDRFGTHTAATCSFSDTNYGQAFAFDGNETIVLGHSASPFARYYTKSGSLAWGDSGSSLLTDNPSGLVGTDLKNTMSQIIVSPDRTIMVTAVNGITAPGKGHHLFYKVANKWIYQGQLPSAVTPTTTLINDMKFTPDGRYLIVSWVNKGMQVWSCGTGSVSYLKDLSFSNGAQNGVTITPTSNHGGFGVAQIGAWTDPAGRSEIDNQIELCSPTYWWKCNEQFDAADAARDLHPEIRNFGSKITAVGTTGNICLSDYATGAGARMTARVTGPPSATPSYAMRALTALNPSLTTNGDSAVDGDTSGTLAFFVKYTSASVVSRTIWGDNSGLGGAGVHVGIHSGHPYVNFGTSGAAARSWWTNSLFNDGNWHFVVIRQPTNGSGPLISVDGVNQAITANPAAMGTSGSGASFNDYWFNSAAGVSTNIGGDTSAGQYDVCHIFIMANTQMTAPQEAAIKSAAGL